MTDETEIRRQLREWIAATSGKIAAGDLGDDTRIIEQRIISSLQVLDLILFIERLSERRVDVESLKPGAFRDIETIIEKFFRASEEAEAT